MLHGLHIPTLVAVFHTRYVNLPTFPGFSVFRGMSAKNGYRSVTPWNLGNFDL